MDVKKIKRKLLFLYQRLTRGFDDSETWSLDYTIAQFVLPRFRRYRQVSEGMAPNELTENDWNKILDDIEFFLEYHSLSVNSDQQVRMSERPDFKSRYLLGSSYWGKYFSALWW